MYILNINKSYGTNTPQILGRVADLPYMDFEFMFKDGTKAVDLTGCTVEFRGTTPTYNKIISTDSVKVKDAKNGTIDFKIPKNFYSAPGAFKRAYFAIKKNGRVDTTQDVIIHVLESVDMDAQDAENIIDAVDDIIAKVEKQIKQDTDRLIKQIKDDTASTIADSNKKLADLDKQISDFKTNTNATISQINSQLSKINSGLASSDTRLKELEKKINDNDLVKRPEFLKLRDDFDNLTYTGINYISGTNWESEFGTSFKILDDKRSELEFKTHKGNKWARIKNESPTHMDWVEGKKYTLSFYVKVDNPNTTNRIRSLIATNVGSGNITGTINITPTSEYQLISKTFEYHDTGVEGDIYFQIFSDYSADAGEDLTMWIKDVVLTDGNKVHNWSPSIDDVVYVWQLDELVSKVDNLEKIVTALGGS